MAVNFSIMDFHKISNGEHNAGDITLNWRGKLDKVNNHVGILRGFNNTQIDAKTTLAVKFAFIDALESSSSLDKKELLKVRQELGLPEKGGMNDLRLDFDMSSVKPLTRAKTREIINRYALNINLTLSARDGFTLDPVYDQDEEVVGYKSEQYVTSKWADLKSADARRDYEAKMRLAGEVDREVQDARTATLRSLGAAVMQNGADALPSHIRSSNAFKAIAPALRKDFAKTFSAMLLGGEGSDVNGIAMQAMKKTLIAALSKDMDEGQRNYFKHMVDNVRLADKPANVGDLDFVTRAIGTIADRTVNQEGCRMTAEEVRDWGMEPFNANDAKPIELRKAEVVDRAKTFLREKYGKEITDDQVKALMEQMSKWQDITPGQLKNIEDVMKRNIADYIDRCIKGIKDEKSTDILEFDDRGMCSQLTKDATRSNFKIGDTYYHAAQGNGGIFGQLTSLLPDKADLRLVTGLMNQTTVSSLYALCMNYADPGDMSPEPKPLRSLDPDGAHVANCNASSTTELMGVFQPNVNSAQEYALQIDGDGKTAKLTISVDYLLRPSFNMDGGGNPQADGSDIFGKAGFKVEINIAGLGSGNPSISSVGLGQEIKNME